MPQPKDIAMTIDCAFYGFLAADAEARTSQAGKSWTRLRVGVGKDDAVQWVQVSVFGKPAESVAELKKMDRVYIERTIKLNTWQGSDGRERYGLSVAAFKCEPTHRIGRNGAIAPKDNVVADRGADFVQELGAVYWLGPRLNRRKLKGPRR
jgi:single-strand DNA-binding protein